MNPVMTMFWTFIGFILFFTFVFLFWFVNYMTAHRLIIRRAGKDNHFVSQYLMHEKWNKKNGRTEWKSVIWQKKVITEKPPSEAVDVGPRGKFFAECYIVAPDQYCWIADKGIKIKKETSEDGITKWNIVDILADGTVKVIDSFQPVTVTQRTELIEQIRKSEEISKQKGWTAERITTMASIGILGMIIILALVFGKDIYKGLHESQDRVNQLAETNAQITQDMGIIAKSLGVQIEGLKSQTPEKEQELITTKDEIMPR